MAGRGQALRNNPQLQRYVIPNVRPTGKQLGVGSYGSVEEVEINDLICAGKRIHETLIEAGNAGLQNVVRRYVEECQLMSDMRHPHIVQFMGVCFLPNSSLPLLVMERLLMSLDDLLENTPDIPLFLKRSMLADVAKGLVYLHNHSSPIIHRDLSAKNVLLNSAMTAKISDLGNSRIVDLQPDQLVKTLSCVPGTLVYMPPEALYSLPGYEVDKSHYGTKIDIFSFGHLSLFTITQDFPGNLLPPTYPDPNSRGRLVALTEVERRGRYIDQIRQQLGERHPMAQLIKQCLDNDPEYRPSSKDMLQRLEEMKGYIRDPYQDFTKVEMIKLLEQKDREIQSKAQHGQGSQAMEVLRSQVQFDFERALRAELEVKGDQLGRLHGEIDTMGRDLRALQSDISTKDRQLQMYYTQLQEKNRQLQEKDRNLDTVWTDLHTLQSDISTKDMLLSSVRADVEARESRMREEIRQKDTEIERLSRELRTFQPRLQTQQPHFQPLKGRTPPQTYLQPPPAPQTKPAVVEPIHQPGVSLLWMKCANLPLGMRQAQAVVLKNKVYVGCGYTGNAATEATLYIYTPTADTWTALPCPTRYSALTTHRSQLVLAGGRIASTDVVTNQLWVLQEDDQTWRQPLPAMPTARYGVSAISHNNHLIVPGGRDRHDKDLTVVEVYDGRRWTKTDPVPGCCTFTKSAVCNDTCYLMGGLGQDRSVYCASLKSLIAKAIQQSLRQISVWGVLPLVPYKYSATTVLGDALVAVGGRHDGGTFISSVGAYSTHTRQWHHVDQTPVAVSSTCTITLPTGEMMMIGGWTEDARNSRIAYKASLQA